MALWALLMPASKAYPCGLCYEDNRAAVYSYEAVQKVKANPDKFEFIVLKIKGKLSQETADQIRRWLSERGEIDPTTVKVSTLQKSIGFVADKSFPKNSLLDELSRAFSPLTFELLPYDDNV